MSIRTFLTVSVLLAPRLWEWSCWSSQTRIRPAPAVGVLGALIDFLCPLLLDI